MNPSPDGTRGEEGATRPAPAAAIPERRQRGRVRDRFPMTLISARGFFGATMISGMTKDYDAAGVCVECPRALAVGTAVRVRLHLSNSISHSFRGLPCEFRGRVAAVRQMRAGGPSAYELVLKWDRPLPEMVAEVVSSYQGKIGLLFAAVVASVMWFKWQNVDGFWYAPLFYVYSLALLTYLVSRFVISWRHRPPPLGDFTPTVSIVISVRNEEKVIARTVETCYQTDYPASKREVLVVDDGSTDRTPWVLIELLKKYPDLKISTLLRTGKRAAMAHGVREASGEIVIFVDSDTFLFPDALRHIVCGFEDPTLGASAGYAEVENANTNALTG